jgi:hypothetical protein
MVWYTIVGDLEISNLSGIASFSSICPVLVVLLLNKVIAASEKFQIKNYPINYIAPQISSGGLVILQAIKAAGP